jgi:hypothetical protein
MSKHQELIDIWRTTSKEPSFLKWLDDKQKKCDFCDKPCGKPWCVTEESEDES